MTDDQIITEMLDSKFVQAVCKGLAEYDVHAGHEPPKTLADATGRITQVLGTQLMSYLTAGVVDAPAIAPRGPVEKFQASEQRRIKQFHRLKKVLEIIALLTDNGLIGNDMKRWLVAPNPDLADTPPIKVLAEADPDEAYTAVEKAFHSNLERVMP